MGCNWHGMRGLNSIDTDRPGSGGGSVCSGVRARRGIRASPGTFVPNLWVVAVELPLEIPSPPVAAAVVPAVLFLIPVCAPSVYPDCVLRHSCSGAVIVLLRELVGRRW